MLWKIDGRLLEFRFQRNVVEKHYSFNEFGKSYGLLKDWADPKFIRYKTVISSVLLSEHLLHKIQSCNEVCLNKCSCDCSVETVTPCQKPPIDKPCGPKGNPGIKGPAGNTGSKGCTGVKEF